MSPTPAATVILVRDGARGLEIFLVKRHRKSSFMSSAFVFPGGKVDPADGGAEIAAVRELFEEAGVLLADPALVADLAAHRARLLASEVTFPEILAAANLAPDLSRLHWWSRWVTPSVEPRRFDAEFFLAELPPGQIPSFDDKETVEELWITPAEAIARQGAGDLRLAPPQLRTMHELLPAADIPAAIAAAARRQTQRVAICPRIVADADGINIFMPWDPGYAAIAAEGDPIAADHLIATPPSRFMWSGKAWKVV